MRTRKDAERGGGPARTVAVIGRPNVGKSALFNRLAGKRISIVDPTAGLTRDRVAADVSHGGVSFTLVDTGGLDFDRAAGVREMARRQAARAVAEADTVILVTDVQEGLVPLDRDIADLARRASKRVIVAANKADNADLEAAAAEFHRLGFPDLFPVSATHGRGAGALLDAVASGIRPGAGNAGPAPFRIAVLGRPNVGKSSYVNRILGEERMIIDAAPGTTRDAVDVRAAWRGRPLTLIDTAGVRRKGKVRTTADFFSLARTRASIRRCDLALLLVDAAEGPSGQDERIARSVLDAGKGCVLCVNKWDLAGGTSRREYRAAMRRRARFLDHVPVVFMSARTGFGIASSLEAAFLVREQMEKRVPTPRLNRTLHGAWEGRNPPARGRRPCRFFYAAQTGVRPPSFVLFVSDRALLDASYANFLENALRRAFGFEGAPIRLAFRNRREPRR
ncbi:MAG: ribosome biogenesis GTPase Der [bacterium]|nr:ribosome biogenesis GTPase Der [bacterium]